MNLEEVVLDEARRLLSRQEASVDTLRTRTTAVLSVAAVVFSLLGQKDFDKLDAWGWIAVASFFSGAVIAIYILWPKDMAFGTQLSSWMSKLDRQTSDPEVAAWNLAEALAGMHVANQDQFDRLVKAFSAACGLLAAQVILWVLSGVS